jgi:hypothetical protein
MIAAVDVAVAFVGSGHALANDRYGQTHETNHMIPWQLMETYRKYDVLRMQETLETSVLKNATFSYMLCIIIVQASKATPTKCCT